MITGQTMVQKRPLVCSSHMCSGGTGKAEHAKLPGAGIGPKRGPGKCEAEKERSCLHRHSAFFARVVVFTRADRLIAAPPRLLRALLIGVTTDY
jgi:hypothetical protein